MAKEPVKRAARKPAERYATHEVSSVFAYLEVLRSSGVVGKSLWYRGIGNVSHSLIPSLFRHKQSSTKADYSRLEQELNATFKMRGFPYTESYKWQGDSWAQLFFMQHYRVPTRLLDWSGSPLIALHFALTSSRISSQGDPETDAGVWVLDPIAWNMAVYEGTRFEGKILTPGDEDARLSRYSPEEVYQSPSNFPPVAMRGIHNSARIVAQQGFFTIYGPEKRSIEDFFCGDRNEAGDFRFHEGCLFRVKIPKQHILRMKEEIFALGISESTIYPDLEGLAVELKRCMGF